MNESTIRAGLGTFLSLPTLRCCRPACVPQAFNPWAFESRLVRGKSRRAPLGSNRTTYGTPGRSTSLTLRIPDEPGMRGVVRPHGRRPESTYRSTSLRIYVQLRRRGSTNSVAQLTRGSSVRKFPLVEFPGARGSREWTNVSIVNHATRGNRFRLVTARLPDTNAQMPRRHAHGRWRGTSAVRRRGHQTKVRALKSWPFVGADPVPRSSTDVWLSWSFRHDNDESATVR